MTFVKRAYKGPILILFLISFMELFREFLVLFKNNAVVQKKKSHVESYESRCSTVHT